MSFRTEELSKSIPTITANNYSFIDDKNISVGSQMQSETDLELLGPKWQIFLVVLYSLTATLSFVGNAIAIWVLTAGKRSSRELRIFLVNLSLSDITMALFSIPFTYTDFMLGRWIFHPAFCPVVQFMQLASVFVSVYTLTAIGIDRYIAIIYPLASSRLNKSFGSTIVLIIWTLGIALGSITWFNSEAEPFQWANKTLYDCRETYTRETGRMFTLFIFIVTFALPISVLTFAYGSVALKMLRHTTPGNADVVRDEAQNSAKIKVIKMLSTIVFLFAICWLPIHILNLFIYFARDWLEMVYQTDFGYKAYIALTIGAHWFSMANSFVNPIIYCFMSENFRTDLKILVTKCCPLIKSKRQRRGTTIRSSDSLHSYRTSMFAMSTKNTSNTGQSLVTMNSIRNNNRYVDNRSNESIASGVVSATGNTITAQLFEIPLQFLSPVKDNMNPKEKDNEKSKSDKSKASKDVKKSAAKEKTPNSGKTELKTTPYDPRFPNQNQTRNCYQNYLDYHRCVKVKDHNYCQWYQWAYRELCPMKWVSHYTL